jgi:hypothetical protein
VPSSRSVWFQPPGQKPGASRVKIKCQQLLPRGGLSGRLLPWDVFLAATDVGRLQPTAETVCQADETDLRSERYDTSDTDIADKNRDAPQDRHNDRPRQSVTWNLCQYTHCTAPHT